ncbi:MAG: hypothetical protein KC912_25525 [Proteobacteria bacterium]|nr:hypothetical protein [Pseudomonadota bacterium]
MIVLLLTATFGGTYLLDMSAASETKVPVLGWQKSVTQTHALVEIEAGSWSQEVCSVEVHDRTPLARTVLPDAFISSLPVTVVPVTLDGDSLSVDLGVSRVGFSDGDLPESIDDQRLIDHEGDGRPGATVQMHITGFGTAGIDVAQISHAKLSGTREGESYQGTIETLRLDQLVLGADHRMLNTTPLLRAVDERSSFTLSPTEAGSCAEILLNGSSAHASR